MTLQMASKKEKSQKGSRKVRQIKELMSAMVRHGITRCAIKEEGLEIELERTQQVIAAAAPQFSFPQHAPLPAHAPAAADAPKATVKEGQHVTSPMVGTFYQAPSSDAQPYVKVGDRVTADTTVCIIEAMKVMNEVKAGVAGVVAEVLAGDAQPVEFGTKLFRIS